MAKMVKGKCKWCHKVLLLRYAGYHGSDGHTYWCSHCGHNSLFQERLTGRENWAQPKPTTPAAAPKAAAAGAIVKKSP